MNIVRTIYLYRGPFRFPTNKDQEVPNPTVESNVDGNEGPVLVRQRPRPRRVQRPMVTEMVEMGPIRKSGRHRNGDVVCTMLSEMMVELALNSSSPRDDRNEI